MGQMPEARSGQLVLARLPAASSAPLEQMGTTAPAIGAPEASQGNSTFSGSNQSFDDITFGPALDQDRLQRRGPTGEMVDVPSDHLAFPKVATHSRSHAARAIGAPGINIAPGLKLMQFIRSTKDHGFGKLKHQGIGPACRWRRQNCGRINRDRAWQVRLYCSCKHRIHLHCTANLVKSRRQYPAKLGTQRDATYSSQFRLRLAADNRKNIRCPQALPARISP